MPLREGNNLNRGNDRRQKQKKKLIYDLLVNNKIKIKKFKTREGVFELTRQNNKKEIC